MLHLNQAIILCFFLPLLTSAQNYLPVSPTTCNNEAEFPGHGDIDGSWQKDYAITFCSWHEIDLYPNSATQSKNYQAKQINYYYQIAWLPGCTLQDRAYQDSEWPQLDGKGMSCNTLMFNAYKQCNNGGVGGYIDVGCLRYSFTGAR